MSLSFPLLFDPFLYFCRSSPHQASAWCLVTIGSLFIGSREVAATQGQFSSSGSGIISGSTSLSPLVDEDYDDWIPSQGTPFGRSWGKENCSPPCLLALASSLPWTVDWETQECEQSGSSSSGWAAGAVAICSHIPLSLCSELWKTSREVHRCRNHRVDFRYSPQCPSLGACLEEMLQRSLFGYQLEN